MHQIVSPICWQVATKEILRFEALWLKHFKDTRGDILKESNEEGCNVHYCSLAVESNCSAKDGSDVVTCL